MGDKRTFDTQFATESDTVEVEDFDRGSVGNQQLVNQNVDITDGSEKNDLMKMNESKTTLKTKESKSDVGDKPQDESFKVFTPQIGAILISNTILHSQEGVPLKMLITSASSNKKDESTDSGQIKKDVLDSLKRINIPWSYQEERNKREKNLQKEFDKKNKPVPLPEKVVGRLLIQEESKNWYKIDLYGEEGFVEKRSVKIDSFDWLNKSHVKDVGEETIKSDKKKQLDESLKKRETDKIENEEKGSKPSEYKTKLLTFSKLSLGITSDEKKLKEAKEDFEKKLKKQKSQKEKSTQAKSEFTEKIIKLTDELKKKITSYNEINQYIKTEREKLLTNEEKTIIKEYKIQILDEKENKETDDLDPDKIIKDIENKVFMSTMEFKFYEESKKQEKIIALEKKLEEPELDEKKKATTRDEIKKIKSPVPNTKPEDFARKEILLFADGKRSTAEIDSASAKALLHYLMKIKTLTKEEESGLFNLMIQYFNSNARIDEVFGYDGNLINPGEFLKKFPKLEFILPSSIIRDKLSKNKEEYKKDKKSFRKENLYPNKNFSIKEFREKKRARKTEFHEKKEEIKAPRKNLKEKSGLIKDKYKTDKKELKKRNLSKKDYKSDLGDRKKEFKQSKKDLREEKQQNPGFIRGLWQKSRKDTAYNSIKEKLGNVSQNRADNQKVVKEVRDEKFKKKSDLSLRTADEQTLVFYGLLHTDPDFYLNAYELEHLRRTEGDSEKVKLKAIQFYEEYFKGRPNLNFGVLGNAKYDGDVNQFYESVVLPGLLFTAFPPEFYENQIPSKPSEIKDAELRFWHKDYFDRFENKNESLEEKSKSENIISGVTSNIPKDELDVNWQQIIQKHPGNYWEAYDLKNQLKDEDVDLDEKKQQLYSFYLLYEKEFGEKGFSTEEELWAAWKGDPKNFFTQIFPKEYVENGELISPTKIYMDFFNALKDGVLKTIVKESGVEYVGNDFEKRFEDFLKANYKWLTPTAVLGLVGSDLFSKESNIFKSVPTEWGVVAGLVNTFLPLNKTFIDYKRSTPLGEYQRNVQHKLRFSNLPYGKDGISSTDSNVPGRSAEFKPEDENSTANYQSIFAKDQKKMIPSFYAAGQYDLLNNRTKNGITVNETKFSAKAFGQYFTLLNSKLIDRDENDPQTYSLISQMYPFLQQEMYKNFDLQSLSSLANLTDRENTDAFLNAMPDSPMFNYGLGLSYNQTFLKNFGISSSLNFAAVNAIPKLNEFNPLNLLSGSLGTTFKADLRRYWKLDAGLNYNFAHTSDLSPDPNATNQDAIKGIGQQHFLSGSFKIGNGFCEFSGSFRNDLMKGEDASSYSFKFNLNQFADIPTGTFSAYIMVDKRPAQVGMQIPSMWLIGGGLVFHLGNILPNQPR